ncbi:hypothetical protein F5X99DRAFT_404484 [Biscogniauxia marginata]|nr:hypothetical protein F5X99DRAFT_404484 [Biscogniauxia marginata]
MDNYSTDDTMKGAIFIDTTCTETISLTTRDSLMVSITTIISSSSGVGTVYTATGTEPALSVATESIQCVNTTEPIYSSPAQGTEYSSLSQQEKGGSTERSTGANVGIGISAGFVAAVLCFTAGWYWRRWKRKKEAEERISPVGRIPELDGGWRPARPQPVFRRSLRESWHLVLQRNQDEEVPPLPKSSGVDPEMSFLDLTPSDAQSKHRNSRT